MLLASAHGHATVPERHDTATTRPAGGEEASYSWLQRNVFSMCMYCHVSVPGASFGKYEEVLRHVVPGSPESSRLYFMVVTRRMPPGRGGLPENHIQAIHRWIKEGARNN